MGLLFKERRGPAWKQGWAENTLSSISAPPLPLLTIVGIVMFLLWVSSYSNYKSSMETAMINLNLLLLLLPLILIFVAHHISSLASPEVKQHLVGREGGGSPWRVAALLVLLLVLLSYHSSLKSMWSPLVWRSY
ncbi:hypothetical protein L6164_024863 [Bauhinia variegata]|uniref:Uncharacterized protein n=1 Tax=Bauhinia variegata TaxID=167791 RepID=A0ACB9M0H5_BAUVA|nr:hypothetical protein L6164_024863 [Bauhinia variegata]